MNNDNNSPMDSLNGLNNEPVTPVEPTPVPGDAPAVEPAITDASPTPAEEPIPIPTNEPVQDIAPTEEPINPLESAPVEPAPADIPAEVPVEGNPSPTDVPAEASPAPTDVVTLTPGENEAKPEGEVSEPSAEVSNPTEAPTGLSSEPATATAIASNPEPVNPVADNPVPTNPVVGNDQTNVGFEAKQSNGSKMKLPIIIVTALVVLGALGYFVIYPFVKNTFAVTPKKVFENTITSLKTQINNTLSNANITNTITDISVKIDSNIEGMESFKDYTYGVRFGIDNKAKALEGKAYMLDKNSKEYGAVGYVKGEDILLKLSHDDRIVKIGKTTDIEGFDDIFDATENINIDDYSYLTNKVVDLVISTFKEEDFVKSDSTFTVNGTEVKVKKNTYTLNKDRIKNLYNTVVNGLYNDSRSMEIISSWGITKEDFKKEFIDDVSFDDIEDDGKLDINIYNNSKNEVVGFDVANNEGKKVVYYYTNEGNFNFFMGEEDGDKSEYITADGVKNGDATDVTIKSNGKDTLATLKIYSWTEDEIKFDFNLAKDVTDGQEVSGSIEYKNTRSSNANNIDLKVSLKSGSDQIGITLNLKQELNAKIANIDTNKAVELSDEEKEKWLEEFLKSLDGTPFGFYSQMLEEMNQPQYYTDDSKCGPGVKCDDTFASGDVGF